MENQLELLIENALDQGVSWAEAFYTFERLYITAALRRCDGRVLDAAALIGIHRNTMTSKIATYHINLASFRRKRVRS